MNSSDSSRLGGEHYSTREDENETASKSVLDAIDTHSNCKCFNEFCPLIRFIFAAHSVGFLLS